MKESAEHVVRVGLHRNPKKVFNDVEEITARMKRDGWSFRESVMEDGLGKIHLFFDREINTIIDWPEAGSVQMEKG